MRQIIAIMHVTLDGVIQSPCGPEEDASGGFTHGGWIWPYGDAVMQQALSRIMSGEFDMILGRRTYEIFAAYWPYAGEGRIAQAFNSARKYVVTRSLDRFDWENSRRASLEEIGRLKQSAGPDPHVWGSSALLQSLIAADLVDEYRLWVYPLILGKGKRLFEAGVPPTSFTLVQSECTGTGVLMNTYRPAGPVARQDAPAETPSEAELVRRAKVAARGTEW